MSKRQQQVANLIQQSLSRVLQKEGFNIYGNAMVTVSYVSMTPDLQNAHIYLSIFNAKNKEEILAAIRAKSKDLRYATGQLIRNKVRMILEMHYYIDDTLDRAAKIEELLKQ